MDLQNTKERITKIINSLNDFSVRKAKLDERKNAATKTLNESIKELENLNVKVEEIDQVINKLELDIQTGLTNAENEVIKMDTSLKEIENKLN